MKKIVRSCWLQIVGKKKTPEEKIIMLGNDIVKDLCMSEFNGNKLTYHQISLVGSVIKEGLNKYLTDSIERHKIELEESIRHHSQQIKEAEEAIIKINN